MALFYNDYRNLRSFDTSNPRIEIQPSLAAYLAFKNQLRAYAYGGEWLLHWKPTERWALEFVYSYVDLQFVGRRSLLSSEFENQPEQQVSLRSGFNITADIELDLWTRYVDKVPLYSGALDQFGPNNPRVPRWEQGIPAYVTLDARLAWRPLKDLELSVTGQNLLDSQHPEFQQEILPAARAQVPRSVYFKFDWQF
jgi:iron complex outermembrane receptor protein